MNKIDKLLAIAKASRKHAYLLVTSRIPIDERFFLKISLQKGGDAIVLDNIEFNTEGEIDAYMDEFHKKYNLTESNTEFVNFIIVPATEENATEDICEVI